MTGENSRIATPNGSSPPADNSRTADLVQALQKLQRIIDDILTMPEEKGFIKTINTFGLADRGCIRFCVEVGRLMRSTVVTTAVDRPVVPLETQPQPAQP
jgi:hypothetical protein